MLPGDAGHEQRYVCRTIVAVGQFADHWERLKNVVSQYATMPSKEFGP